MTEKTLETEVKQKSEELRVLDQATRDTLSDIRRKDARFRRAATVFFLILFFTGVLGIYYQNKLAAENKAHIDCIVKLLATPSQPGQTRHIVKLETCQIKVN